MTFPLPLCSFQTKLSNVLALSLWFPIITSPIQHISSSQLSIGFILEMPIATIVCSNNDTNILHPPSPTQPFRLIHSLLDDHLAPINTRSSSVMTSRLLFSLSFYLGLARLSNALNL